MTMEEEHTYDDKGNISDTQYRCLTISNNQKENPLVSRSTVIENIGNEEYKLIKV